MNILLLNVAAWGIWVFTLPLYVMRLLRATEFWGLSAMTQLIWGIVGIGQHFVLTPTLCWTWAALFAYLSWKHRNDDDDDVRRKRKRIRESIRVRGRKLVVVPDG